jgi:hypothetical protein
MLHVWKYYVYPQPFDFIGHTGYILHCLEYIRCLQIFKIYKHMEVVYIYTVIFLIKFTILIFPTTKYCMYMCYLLQYYIYTNWYIFDRKEIIILFSKCSCEKRNKNIIWCRSHTVMEVVQANCNCGSHAITASYKHWINYNNTSYN